MESRYRDDKDKTIQQAQKVDLACMNKYSGRLKKGLKERWI
jgi:hypothetical protein